MANEIAWSHATGRTEYALIRNRTGQIWSTSGGTGAFENYAAANYADYDIAATEQGSTGYYTATVPAAVPAGTYSALGKDQTGGSPAQTDPTVATGNFEWNGSALFPLADLTTSGQLGQIGPIRLARGVAVSGFPFYLKSAADHITPFVSGVVSGQIARDGGSFVALQSGTFTEMGLGFYRTNFTSGDLLATTAAVVFTANGISGGTSDPLPLSFILQRTSGQ